MLRVAYVSSYSPRQCGIATFTEDLIKHVDSFNKLKPSGIIAINDPGSCYNYGNEVVWQIDEDEITSYKEAAEFVNDSDFDLVNIQHEFGLWGGMWGKDILTFLKKLDKPVVTTMHTTLFPDAKIFQTPESAATHKKVVKGIAKASSAITVMTNTASNILQKNYRVKQEEIRVIPHGSPNFKFLPTEPAKKALSLEGRTVLSTFGLISQDKGIEHAIRALPDIVKEHPDILYLIIGVTHPQVRLHQGEKYRRRLQRIVRELNLRNNVRFHNRFLSQEELIQYLQATDVYICPYNNKEQLSSGTITYAMGAGKPIISTPFYYAEELLAEGRGILCKFRDPKSITNGIREIVENPEKRDSIEKLAYEYGQSMTWPSVALKYIDLFKELAQ